MLPPREPPPPKLPPADPREPLKLEPPMVEPREPLKLLLPLPRLPRLLLPGLLLPLKLPRLPESLKPPKEGADRNDELLFPEPMLGERDRALDEPTELPPVTRLLMLLPDESRNPESTLPVPLRTELELPSVAPRVLRAISDRPMVPEGELRTARPI